MKLKEILSIVCFICLAFSCSMENDTIINDIEKEIDATTDSYTALQFSLSSGSGLSTKTTSDVSNPEGDTDYSEMKDNEKAVNDCFVFVAYNNQIIGRRHYSSDDITKVSDAEGYGNQYTLNKNILFKAPTGNPDLLVYAVGMLADTDSAFTEIFNSVTKLDELKGKTIGNLKDFIKVGEGTVKHYDNDNKNGYQTSDKTKDFNSEGGTVQSGKVNITLTHRAAAIEVVQVNAKNSKGEEVDVTVTDIRIDKQILNARLNSGMATSAVSNETTFKSEQPQGTAPTGYRFYTYETENPTTITIYYQMYEQSYSYSFTIKTFINDQKFKKILANHLYQITLNITNNVADVKVQCYTMDWLSHELSGEIK